MAVRKRGRRWHYDFTINHTRYRGPLPLAKTKRDAENDEDRIRVSVLDGSYDKPKVSRLFEFIETIYWPFCRDNHKSAETDKYMLETIKTFFGDKPLKDISPLLVEKFKRVRLGTKTIGDKPRAPHSVNRELAVLSNLFTHAIEQGVVNSNPVSKVKWLQHDNQRQRYLTDEEEELLLSNLIGPYERIKPVVEFALNTGLRLGEICKLTKGDVDFSKSQIHVRQTKTNRNRIVPMNERASELARAGIENERPTVFDLQSRQVSVSFSYLTRKLKIDNLTFHDLRHSFATRLADAGTDPFTIAELLGHSDIQMTKRYTHSIERNKRKAVESLSSRHKNVTAEMEKVRKIS